MKNLNNSQNLFQKRAEAHFGFRLSNLRRLRHFDKQILHKNTLWAFWFKMPLLFCLLYSGCWMLDAEFCLLSSVFSYVVPRTTSLAGSCTLFFRAGLFLPSCDISRLMAVLAISSTGCSMIVIPGGNSLNTS